MPYGSPMNIEDVIREERLALAERLRGLTSEEWEQPSLCAGWRTRDVLAHIVTPFLVSTPRLVLTMVGSRGFHGAMDSLALKLGQRPPTELLTVLEKNAATPFKPPGMPFEAPMTDIVVHGADIRWAIGDPQEYVDAARLAPMLTFLASPKARGTLVPKHRLAGLRLVATDQDWSHGEGTKVSGPSLALAMAMMGRPSALPHLTGEAKAQLVG